MTSGSSAARRTSRVAIAAAPTFAAPIPAAAERGRLVRAESPITQTPGTRVDSKVLGSTGHQPVLSVSPAA